MTAPRRARLRRSMDRLSRFSNRTDDPSTTTRVAAAFSYPGSSLGSNKYRKLRIFSHATSSGCAAANLTAWLRRTQSATSAFELGPHGCGENLIGNFFVCIGHEQVDVVSWADGARQAVRRDIRFTNPGG